MWSERRRRTQTKGKSCHSGVHRSDNTDSGSATDLVSDHVQAAVRSEPFPVDLLRVSGNTRGRRLHSKRNTKNHEAGGGGVKTNTKTSQERKDTN